MSPDEVGIVLITLLGAIGMIVSWDIWRKARDEERKQVALRRTELVSRLHKHAWPWPTEETQDAGVQLKPKPKLAQQPASAFKTGADSAGDEKPKRKPKARKPATKRKEG